MVFAHSKEKADKNFLFGGLAWDVPDVTGGFYANGKPSTLNYWIGKDSCALLKGNTHQYNTYSEGKAVYFSAIRQAASVEFSGRLLNCIYEPYDPYSFIKGIEKLAFFRQSAMLENSFVTEECGNTAWATGTEFVDDSRLFISGLVSKDRMGSTTPDNHDLKNNLTIASKAAINGAWFNWYGRFSGSGDNVSMSNIYEVPNWLQLIRVVANWDNLNGIPISNRSINGTSYTSLNSRMDENLIYSRQPETQKLFVVFLNNYGEITLNPGEKIVSIKQVDTIFRETVEGSADLSVVGNKIRLVSR
jgi:hypothetical protein